MVELDEAPKTPWPIGRSGDLIGARIEVSLVVDSSGRLWSANKPATPADEHALSLMSGGGARSVAHALLVETIRREAFVCALVRLSADPSFASSYGTADDAGRKAVVDALETDVRDFLLGFIPSLLGGAAREILEMLAAQTVKTPIQVVQSPRKY